MADGVLDSVVRLFADSAEPFMVRGVVVALSVFVTLATIHLAWDLMMWALRDRGDLFGLALRKFLLLSFFYLLIVALPLWLPRLLDGFEQLGRLVTGLEALSPSSVFEQGVALAFSLFDSWKKLLILLIPFAGTLQTVTFWLVLASFTLIAFQLARLLVEGSLVLGGLVVFLGASAHRATFGLFEGYVRYAFDVGIRLFVVYLLVGVGHNLGAEWDRMLTEATAFDLADPRFLLSITASAGFYALLVQSLPKAIASALTGSFNFAGHNPLADPG